VVGFWRIAMVVVEGEGEVWNNGRRLRVVVVAWEEMWMVIAAGKLLPP